MDGSDVIIGDSDGFYDSYVPDSLPLEEGKREDDGDFAKSSEDIDDNLSNEVVPDSLDGDDGEKYQGHTNVVIPDSLDGDDGGSDVGEEVNSGKWAPPPPYPSFEAVLRKFLRNYYMRKLVDPVQNVDGEFDGSAAGLDGSAVARFGGSVVAGLRVVPGFDGSAVAGFGGSVVAGLRVVPGFDGSVVVGLHAVAGFDGSATAEFDDSSPSAANVAKKSSIVN